MSTPPPLPPRGSLPQIPPGYVRLRDGEVIVRLADLQLLKDFVPVLREFCEIARRMGVDANMHEARLNVLMKIASDPDKTPARPPSSDQVRAAFEVSSEFGNRDGRTQPQSLAELGLVPPKPR